METDCQNGKTAQDPLKILKKVRVSSENLGTVR